jgi:hypothetical protein
MGVEAPDEMLGIADVQCMLAERPTERLAQRAFAGAASANKHESDTSLFIGVLHAPGDPVDDVLVDLLIAGCEHFADVLAK